MLLLLLLVVVVVVMVMVVVVVFSVAVSAFDFFWSCERRCFADGDEINGRREHVKTRCGDVFSLGVFAFVPGQIEQHQHH